MEILGDGDMLVTGAGRSVYDEEVEISPIDIENELFDEASFARTPPDDGVVLAVQQKANGNHAQVFTEIDGRPATVAAHHLAILKIQHPRNRRST